MLDHNNGKPVKAVTENSITFEDGTRLTDLLSVVTEDFIGTKLLKVEQPEDVAYLTFGHTQVDPQRGPLPPLIVGVVEATGDVLPASEAEDV